MKNNIEVVAVGAAIVDLPLCPIPADILTRVSYPVDQIAMVIGGDAINEATILSRLGHTARLVSCVGNDAAGHYILTHCRQNRIDTDYVVVKDALSTSINVGLIGEDGERTFITNRHGSLWQYAPADIDLEALNVGTILSFASIFNNPLLDSAMMIRLFEKAKSQGMTICADVVKSRFGETVEDIRGALAYVDYFFPNLTEARELTGKADEQEIAEVFLSCGVKNVVVKLGKKGAYFKNADGGFYVDAYPYANCIDTTGAGDNFAAAFICGLLEGLPVRACTEFACAVASIAVEALGATAGVQNRAQADLRYRDYLDRRNAHEND